MGSGSVASSLASRWVGKPATGVAEMAAVSASLASR